MKTNVPDFAAIGVAVILAAGTAWSCPDPTKYGETYEFSGRDLYQERLFDVVAGGDYSVTNCRIRPKTDRGNGYVTSTPDFSFNLNRMSQYRLVISVVSECDSVLLINTATRGWYYDDDDNGNLDARIVLTRPANGWLDVWVGTYDEGDICDAVLSLETFDR